MDATNSDATNSSVTELLNDLLGAYWGAIAQHQTHVALVESWGIAGLAQAMRAHTDDEPGTVRALSDRLLDLGGQPTFTIGTPTIGTTLREVLDNDLEAQRHAQPALNTAAEVAAAAHDATTRILVERILADEEDHLYWLQSEIDLLERLGEPLYLSNRLTPTPTPPAV